MTDLIVLVFQNDRDAFTVRDHLIELQKQHLIRLGDAAVAVRDSQGHVKIKQIVDLTAQGAMGGAFWGLMAGILFWMPAMGMAIGTLIGALSGALTDYGVNDEFISQVAREVEPGQSALFLLVLDATMDRVIEQIAPWKPRVLRTNLSREQEQRLRAAFSEAQMEDHLHSASATQPLPQK